MLLLGLAAALPLAWQGRATVHDGRRRIAIGVDSRIEADGRIVSQSWPLAEGRAAGERRLVIDPTAMSATLQRGTNIAELPPAFAVEEVAQFGMYRQYQVAVSRCSAEPDTATRSVVIVIDAPGSTATAFRCMRGRIVSAANWVAGSSPPVRQEFRFAGQWRDGAARFPRSMAISRDGKPYFDLRVTRFQAD